MIDKFFCWLAWRLPKSLVKWCFVRVATWVSAHELSDREMGSITCVEALKGWTE